MHKIQHSRRTQAAFENRERDEIVISGALSMDTGRLWQPWKSRSVWQSAALPVDTEYHHTYGYAKCESDGIWKPTTSDNADHLFQSQMKHSFAKPNEHASYSHASLTISQSKWSDNSAAGAPDLTCIGFGKISKDLIWRSHYGGWGVCSRFFWNKRVASTILPE